MTTDVLLAGLGGALVVFLLGIFREWWREEREREGLLRLLLSEIDHNAEVVRTVGEKTNNPLGAEDFLKISADTWRELQGRAAALLPDDLFAVLNGYYSPLQTLLTLLEFEDHNQERLDRVMSQVISGRLSEALGEEFQGLRNPWNYYLEAMQNTQKKAQEGILNYIAFRWNERLLLRVSQWGESRWRCPPRTE